VSILTVNLTARAFDARRRPGDRVHGHTGGDRAAKFAAREFAPRIGEMLTDPVKRRRWTFEPAGDERADPEPQEALIAALLEIDDALAQSGDYAEVGATACAAIVDDAAITVAWLGDSRCVLARGDGSVRALSRDHTPDSPTETSRTV
jgi:serine/threonine protein phosphatase PrpC